MPTLDAQGHLDARLARPRSAREAGGIAIRPATWRNEGPVRRVLASIADADALLATGHLSAPEIGWLVRAARDAGVRRILVTHATYTVPNLAIGDLRELVELGLTSSHCLQLLHRQAAMRRDSWSGSIGGVG